MFIILVFFFNLTYSIFNFGNNVISFVLFLNCKSLFCKFFCKIKLTKFLIGYHIFYRSDFLFFSQYIKNICLIFKNLVNLILQKNLQNKLLPFKNKTKDITLFPKLNIL